MPTKQETFDTVITHLRKQGAKARDDLVDRCLYRASGGKMCAAGCLIPDSQYRAWFEGATIGETRDHNAVTQVISCLGHDLRLVKDLQLVHDLYGVERWEEQFERVAKQHNLIFTEKKDADETGNV